MAKDARVDKTLPRMLRLPEVTEAGLHDGVQRLATREPHRTVPALMALIETHGAELTALNTHHATLDDVFLAKTGRQLRDE
jgi:ABC-2 type transport system ATP-binding protein